MSLTIIQKPLYKILPASSPVYYTVIDSTVVSTKFKVKYVADIHVLGNSQNAITSNNLINTIKVSPNAVGVGIMDIKSILSSQVDVQRNGNLSTFKGASGVHSIHLIDGMSRDGKGMMYYVINFRVEYSDTASGIVIDSGQAVADDPRLIYNGYIASNEVLQQSGADYGYDLMTNLYINNGNGSRFLTDMPLLVYAREHDFGTVSFFDNLTVAHESFDVGSGFTTTKKVDRLRVEFYSDSIGLGVHTINDINSVSQNRTDKRCSVGIYPANIYNSFGTLPVGLTYYTFQAFDDDSNAISELYTVRLISEDCKGYEGIRLAWLNKFGVYDYYTFIKKSIRSLTSKRNNYTQHSGTWNDTSFNMAGHLGGQRSYNVSSKEQITINTDYITEEEGIFLESLVMSPEVYIINQNEVSDSTGLVNKYVEPVLLTNNSIQRKTRANDRLINHTFTIEKSKTTNTQRI